MNTNLEKSISLESELNKSERTNKKIKEKTLKLLENAKEIIQNNPSKNLQKEYEDLQKTTINALKYNNPIIEAKENLYILNQELSNGEINQEEYLNIQREYNDLSAKNDKFEFDKEKFLEEKEGKYILKNKINKWQKNYLKNDAEKFINSHLSLSDLSSKQVGWLISGIFILGEPYTKQFKEKLSNDPKGLIFVEKNWGKGGKIDTKLQIPATELNPLINNLIESTSNAINNEIQTILFEAFPKKSKEEIFLIALETSKEIELNINRENPNAIIEILDKIIKDKKGAKGKKSVLI